MLQLWTDYRLYGKPRYYIAEEEENPMQIPDEVRKSVVFVCMHEPGSSQFKAVGTAFLVSLENKEIHFTFGYIVTAKHVINGIKSRTTEGPYLRINKLDGTSIIVSTNINDWKFHPSDESVDVAVINVGLSTDIYDVRYIPTEMATTPEVIKQQTIDIGDEVFITGLFVNHIGRQRNTPIIRTGNLSLMADTKEPINTTLGDMEAYLIEARSIGGLSGSPVFVYLGVIRHIGGQVKFVSGDKAAFTWIGLMHGHWKLPSSAKDVIIDETEEDQQSEKHTGIGIVVPATKILEVINNNEEFMNSRKNRVDEIKKKNLPTPDIVGNEPTKEEFVKTLEKVSQKITPSQPAPSKPKT
jgi:hypothetical protein